MQNKLEKNIKTYKTYSSFSYDVLFFYGIQFIFFNQIKHIDFGTIVLISSLFPLFRILLQIPATMLTQKLGNKKSTILCNSLIIVSLFLYIIAPNIITIIIGDLIYAFGVSIKNISETNLIYIYLKLKDGNLNRLNNINGKASSRFLTLDAVTGLLSGVLFVVNPYLPIILGMVFFSIPIIISFRFDEFNMDDIGNKKDFKTHVSSFKEDFKRIFQSKRLLSLFLHILLFFGIMRVTVKYYGAYLTAFHYNTEIFGIVYTILALVQAASAYKQDKIEGLNKRRILTILSVPYAISFILIGIISMFNIQKELLLVIFILILCIQGISIGVYRIFIQRYLSSFTNIDTRIPILTTYNLVANIGQFVVLFIAGIVLDKMPIQNAYIVMGAAFTILMLLITNFMKNRIGLNHEKYGNEDRFE